MKTTFPISHFPLPIGTAQPPANPEAPSIGNRQSTIGNPAFTLIELLVVISVILALAALTFPAVRAVKLNMIRARAKSELVGLQTAIENYKDKLGYYPPDNRINAKADPYALNQLYYELLGTTNYGGFFHTLDNSAQISADPNVLIGIFGANAPGVPNVSGFMNCAQPRSGDEIPSGVAFIKGLKSSQWLTTTYTTPACTVIGANLDGPLTFPGPNGTKINPWRYNSSSPHNNTKTFDLWIDVAVADKTNRICNWSDKYTIVSVPYQ